MIATGRHGARRAGMARGGARKRTAGAVKADINVTPLVDVVLVLLIIFMVVTPMLNKGVNVDLPITRNHDKRNDDNRDIVVAITERGDVYVGSDPVPLGGLGRAVADERRRHPDKGIFLKGDGRLEYGKARQVMEALHVAGFDRLELGTEEARGANAVGQGAASPGVAP